MKCLSIYLIANNWASVLDSNMDLGASYTWFWTGYGASNAYENCNGWSYDGQDFSGKYGELRNSTTPNMKQSNQTF